MSEGLSETWRKATVDRWYDAQDHVGQADTDPEWTAMAVALAQLKAIRHA